MREEITLDEYRRLTGTRTAKKARMARPDIPRADADERTGLTPLLVAGWSLQSPDCVRYRLYQPGGADTGLCDSLKAACDEAKRLTREAHNGR